MKATFRNPYNQIPHLTQDTIWENNKKNTRKHHIQERAKRSVLSQQVITRLQGTDNLETRITKRSTRSTSLEWNIKKLLEGLNMFNGTILTLIEDLDQEK